MKNPDIKFTVVDINSERIDTWNSTTIPVYEPGLWDVLRVVSACHQVPQGKAIDIQHSNGSSMDDNTSHDPPGDQNCTPNDSGSGIAGHRAPNLFFSDDVRGTITAADMVFITVNTPSKVITPLYLEAQI